MVRTDEIDTVAAGPDLDALVSDVVMGRCPHTSLDTISYQGRFGWVVIVRCLDCGERPPFKDFTLQYSSDLRAAYAVEDRIQALGLTAPYVQALCSEIADTTPGYFAAQHPQDESLFLVAHASHEQRCRAALKAVLAANGPYH